MVERHRQRSRAPATEQLTRAEFVAILVDRGIAPERAESLCDALKSDTQLVRAALETVTLRANAHVSVTLVRARARRYN